MKAIFREFPELTHKKQGYRGTCICSMVKQDANLHFEALALIAGIPAIRTTLGRYCLNGLHCAAGSAVKHAAALWERQAGDLMAELQKDTESYVLVKTRGRTGGTYACKERVYAYAMWAMMVTVCGKNVW